MFAQPQQDNSREVARVLVHRDTSESPATAGRRDHPIVGHRLAHGYMAVHAPGQPCRYCDDPQASWQPPQTSQPVRPAGPARRVVRAARKYAAAGAVLTASMLALAVPLGRGSASAATRPATPASAVTWHNLALINGWQPGPIHYPGTGDPQWAVSGGVVYLSGSVVQTSGASNEFAVLPRAARPAHSLWITIYTLGGTQGYLTIFPNGSMSDTSSPPNNAQDYTSLAAVSFPARSLAAHKLALRNGWHSSQSAYNSGDPSYSVSHGVVYLSGSLHGGTGANRPFAMLPRGIRPAHFMFISVYTFSGTAGLLEIGPDGNMYAGRVGQHAQADLAERLEVR